MRQKHIDKTDNLGTENIPKLVFSFFITAFIGLVLNSIYNLTDTLFISRGIGDTAMGGVSIVMPFVLLQGAISTMIGGGAATIVSIKLGEKKYSEAGNYTFNAMILFYLIAVFITIFGLIFINEILRFLGAKNELFDYAKDYFTIILIGNIFSTGFSSIIRAEGKIFYGMLIWIIPITLNIVLDAIFILVLDLGIKGSALATVISQFVSFIFCVVFFTKFSTQQFKHLKIKQKNIFSIVKIGLPALVQIASFSIITAIMNIIISKISGDIEIIAFGYINKLIYYLIVPFMALSLAISPIISYNFGQNNDIRIKETLVFSIKIALIYAVFAILLAEAIPNYLIMIFTNTAKIISIGENGLRIIAISLIFMPLQMIIGAKYQAIGKTFMAIIIYSLNFVLIILPAILLSKSIGLNGVWLSYTIAYCVSAIIILIGLLINYYQRKKCNI